ncbi:hypothetical protein [Acaryochloris sp. CCMEE 5410]|uniref:hypothetical protein n=1 Tax=Acaryochloris sp. CCMEE 5410 TaxID=310037 RepID=UPI00031E493D|nr:hypothetical protein [Acaryochloris sp. CCMEE 5410]KAI9132353.1 hypothetical protein ON05_002485 [Acaryochloris sp. CCMEE 5410]
MPEIRLGILLAVGCTFVNGELVLRDEEINVTPKGLKRFYTIWQAPTRTSNDTRDNSSFSTHQ